MRPILSLVLHLLIPLPSGPKVIHQVPDHSVDSPNPTAHPPLVSWDAISAVVIPRQSLTSYAFTLLVPPYRLLTHSIRLISPHYPRNEFLFSVSLLLHRRDPFAAHRPVATKLAHLLAQLERDSNYLSADPSPPNSGRVFALCEILREDLNSHSECMIPLVDGGGAALNLKLFPTYPPPPPGLAPYHVPLATVRLAELAAANDHGHGSGWDLTVRRLLPFIDGVNSLARVAGKADVDYRLARAAVAHLIYYGCAILLDVFSFGAMYAPTPEMAAFVADAEMQAEARAYVVYPDIFEDGPGLNNEDNSARRELAAELLGGAELVELYCSLRQGQTMRTWCLEHAEVVGLVDVRRFVTFGVIKGFLYRVHKYAIDMGPAEASNNTRTASDTAEDDEPEVQQSSGRRKGNTGKKVLRDFLGGAHCFDEICTELQISERELMARLQDWGDVQIIQR